MRDTLSVNTTLPRWSLCCSIVCLLTLASLTPAVNADTDPVLEEQTWTVNFKDTDIQEVIKFVAEVTQKTMVVDPQVKGRVKVISSESLNRQQLYQLFLSVLEIHGFSAVSVGDIVRVIPAKEVRTTPVPVVGRGGSSAIPLGATRVTQIIELKNITAVKILPVIRPLVPAHAYLAAYAPSNSLIITDTQANIERLRTLIKRIDTAALDATELVPLRHASAEEVVRMVTQLARSDKGGSGENLVLVADKRTNGILLSGDDVQRLRIRNLIQRLDQAQPQSGNVRVIYLKYARAEQVAKVLARVLDNMQKLVANKPAGHTARATVEADKDTNALLITADPESLQSLLAVIDRLDIRRAQVLVEAIIVEMTDTSGEDLGVQWLFRNNDRGFGSSIIGDGSVGGIIDGALDERNENSDGIIGALSSIAGQTLGIGRTGGSTDFLVLLNALQQESGANILSTPNLLTLDNHPATISVGQNVPFVTGSYTSSNNSVDNPFQTIERQNVGIQLQVTPHLNEGDSVVLDIVQEVSSLSGATGINASDVITNERKISTRIMAEDGEIVVLGGLIKDDVQAFEQRVPLLGSVPWLGRLFRSNSSKITKTNLMVFIRATVIRERHQLTGATADKYRLIRDKQLNSQHLGAVVVERGAASSLLPSWPALETTPALQYSEPAIVLPQLEQAEERQSIEAQQ